MTPTIETVRAAFAFEPCLFKGEAKMPKGQAKPAGKLAAIIAARMAELVDAAIAWAVAQLPTTETTKIRSTSGVEAEIPNYPPLYKADPPKYDFTDLLDSITEQMVKAALHGAGDIGETFGVDLSTAPAKATAYAQARAAAMVGKKLVDGVLIDNPNTKYAISEQLRAAVRDKVAAAIKDGWSTQKLASSLRGEFEPWRAQAIARTETGMVYGNGAAEGYTELGVELLQIVDGPGCLPSGHDDAAPLPSGTPGVIEEEAQANGQVWTVEQYQSHLVGHPNCVRGAVPAQGETA